MAGNLCRCGCYKQIFEAIETVAAGAIGDGGDVHGGGRPMSAGRVGQSPNRVGGIDRVTGAQQYLADIHAADALHAKLVTVPCARARIISVDGSRALRLAGVHLVLTADDLPVPVPRFGPQNADRPVLATGETNTTAIRWPSSSPKRGSLRRRP